VPHPRATQDTPSSLSGDKQIIVESGLIKKVSFIMNIFLFCTKHILSYISSIPEPLHSSISDMFTFTIFEHGQKPVLSPFFVATCFEVASIIWRVNCDSSCDPCSVLEMTEKVIIFGI